MKTEMHVEKWNQAVMDGRPEAWDALVAEQVVDRTGGLERVGRSSFKERVAAVRAVFSDVTVRADDVVVTGDRIVWRWTLEGTQVAPFGGIAATNARVQMRGVNFQRLEGGRVMEHWTLVDVAGAMAQLKALAPQ